MTTENKNSQSQDDQTEFNQEQYNILKRCSEKKEIKEWNSYRVENPKSRIHLENADLMATDLEGADLEGANLVRANLKGANLVGANLEGANLVLADLALADLRRSNLRKAFLSLSNLRGANLVRANLEGASLVGTNLKGANLAGAIYGKATLAGAQLKGAIYGKATLAGAKLKGANLGERIKLKKTYTRRIKKRRATVRTLIKSTEQVELVINLADDITYEEVTNLLRALNGLHSILVGLAPYLNEIQIGQHTKEYAVWEEGQT